MKLQERRLVLFGGCRDLFGEFAIFCCKKFEIVAFSIIFLRKDAHIGGFRKQNAKRATSANNFAELL